MLRQIGNRRSPATCRILAFCVCLVGIATQGWSIAPGDRHSPAAIDERCATLGDSTQSGGETDWVYQMVCPYDGCFSRLGASDYLSCGPKCEGWMPLVHSRAGPPSGLGLVTMDRDGWAYVWMPDTVYPLHPLITGTGGCGPSSVDWKIVSENERFWVPSSIAASGKENEQRLR